jgi:cytochrome c553
MNENTGDPLSTNACSRSGLRPPRSVPHTPLAAALLALAASTPALAEEDRGAGAARPCGTCHDRSHFEELRWESYRAGLAGHPAANGIVAGLDEADRRAIARHFGIPGTPDGGADEPAESGRR